jgi:hypothetical protein
VALASAKFLDGKLSNQSFMIEAMRCAVVRRQSERIRNRPGHCMHYILVEIAPAGQ